MCVIARGAIYRGRSVQRWGRRQFNLLALAAGWGVTCAHSTVTDLPKVRLGLSLRASMTHFPLVLADQMGYFKALGIQIEWCEFDSETQVQQALTAGLVDVVSGPFEQVFDLNEHGQKIKAFVLQSRTPQISLGIAMRRLASFQNLSDLKRFKIGISDWGSSSHAMAVLWSLQAGLNPRDMTLVPVGAMNSAIDHLRGGAVDALCHMDPLMSWLEYKSEVRVVAETRSLQGTQLWMGGPSAATCLFAKTEFIQLKSELIQGLTDGVVRALKWLMTAGPSDLLKSVPAHAWEGDRAFYLGTVDKLRESYCPDGQFGQELLQTAWRSRALRLGLNRPLVVDRAALQAAYTNESVYKSKKRFAV